ncbi:toll/interleukin-1 receptor domain-containing protein [Ktedonospora formicarum]|uniref:TIR domain-containing protein n=1 Tax=Ktedonospora formicarum TaxID=2778364 RepID=A0A8J3MVZ3_9CHLR|nr:toll/interleukin-1 receptor domain-containing protein [Ktedonospora formicarum]GHO50877.1 hypothetical protein KSX_90400 [Ktedonospora formicarum]
MAEKSLQPLELLYCYAHKDRALRDELDSHLAGLRREGLITVWYDGEISPGAPREQETKIHLESAHIILLLVSAHFLNSDYCYSKEMICIIERHLKNEAHVIPILLRPVDWSNTPFSQMPMLPSNARPITVWQNRDSAFEDVAKGIHRVVDALLQRQSPSDVMKHANYFVTQNTARISLKSIEAVIHIIDDFIVPPPWSSRAEIHFSITNLSNKKTFKLAKLVLHIHERNPIEKVRLKKPGAPFREYDLFADIADSDEIDLLKGTNTQFVIGPRETEAFRLSLETSEGFLYLCQLSCRLDNLIENNQSWIEGNPFQLEHPIRSIDVLRARKRNKT